MQISMWPNPVTPVLGVIGTVFTLCSTPFVWVGHIFDAVTNEVGLSLARLLSHFNMWGQLMVMCALVYLLTHTEWQWLRVLLAHYRHPSKQVEGMQPPQQIIYHAYSQKAMGAILEEMKEEDGTRLLCVGTK
jgi:hypothetical protein